MMNQIELWNKLSLHSPFVLKKKIEEEDHLEFKDGKIILNSNVAGAYRLGESDRFYFIECLEETLRIPRPLLIAIDYNDKPVIVANNKAFNEEALGNLSFDDCLMFIPQSQFTADEKAEL